MKEPRKILAIIFKYLGDVAITVPALRALRQHYPNCELHVLVAQEAAPLLNQIPWITRVWTISRTRGRAQPMKNWPVIRALQQERFDRSVDFVGNDRGAILSFLCGATHRLAPMSKRGFLGRRFCYNQKIPEADTSLHEVKRHLHTLSAWKIPPPSSLDLETHASPEGRIVANSLVPDEFILCHITTSQPKKEWPVEHWIEFHRLMSQEKYPLIFAAGPGAREQALLSKLAQEDAKAKILPAINNLEAYLAVLEKARLFVSGDTGPLHFAAGLKVPTLSLFAASSAIQWAPRGKQHCVFKGTTCRCSGHAAVCTSQSHCMAAISPEKVFAKAKEFLSHNAGKNFSIRG